MPEEYPPIKCIDYELVNLHDEGVIYDSFFRVYIWRAGKDIREYCMRDISRVLKMIDRHPELQKIGALGWINRSKE